MLGGQNLIYDTDIKEMFIITSRLNSNSEMKVITLTGNDLVDFFLRKGVIIVSNKKEVAHSLRSLLNLASNRIPDFNCGRTTPTSQYGR